MTAPGQAPPPGDAQQTPEGERRRALLVAGSTGLNRWGGAISEEWLPQLRGGKAIRVYREMADNDDTVAALLFAITMAVRQVPWKFEPASDQPDDRAAADFAESCRSDMEHPWDALVEEALSFLTFGWSWHEVCYKVRLGADQRDPTKRSQYEDGFYGWRKLPIRSQDSWRRWVFDEASGDVTAMVQAAPPTYREVTLPRDRALHFTARRFKGNPEGRSILRTVYRAWWYKKRLEEIEAIGVERNLAGLPYLLVPQEILMAGATAEQLALRADLEQLLADIRVDARTAILAPNEEAGYKLGLLGGQGSTNVTSADPIIQRWRRAVLQTCLADFIVLGHEGVGSFALADSKTSMFSKAVGAWVAAIADEVNSSAVPRLFRLNRGLPKFPKVTVLPRLTVGDVETRDLQILAAFVSTLAAVGFDVGGDRNLEAYLRRTAGLPERIEAAPEGEATTQPAAAPPAQEAGVPGAAEAQPAPSPPPPEKRAGALLLDEAGVPLDAADRASVWKAADLRLTIAERRTRNVAAQYVREAYGAVVKALLRRRPVLAGERDVAAWLERAIPDAAHRAFALGTARALEAAMGPAAVAAARLAERKLGRATKATAWSPRDFQRALRNYLGAKPFRGQLAEVALTTQTRLRDVLVRAVADGLDFEGAAQRVQDALDLDSVGRAATIARTETLGAMNAAAMAGYEEAGAQGKEWLATLDERTRDPHAAADGQVVALADAFDVDGEDLLFPGDPSGSPGNIINCLLPGTVVSGAVEQALQADYAGPARELHTARGHRLRLTPNHPVLTAQGWLPAHALREGDEVFSDSCYVVAEGPLRQVDDEDAPAPVEHVFEALAAHGTARRIEIAALDLHGDARFTQGQVHVVAADNLLLDDADAALPQGGDERGFVYADTRDVPHRRDGPLSQGSEAVTPSSVSAPCGSALPFDCGAVTLAERPFGCLRFGPASHWQPALAQTTEEERTRHVEFICQLLEASAGAIALDRLVEVRNIAFRGHVYDLQTRDGWIIAGSIVTSNCRCTVAPAAPPAKE